MIAAIDCITGLLFCRMMKLSTFILLLLSAVRSSINASVSPHVRGARLWLRSCFFFLHTLALFYQSRTFFQNSISLIKFGDPQDFSSVYRVVCHFLNFPLCTCFFRLNPTDCLSNQLTLTSL